MNPSRAMTVALVSRWVPRARARTRRPALAAALTGALVAAAGWAHAAAPAADAATRVETHTEAFELLVQAQGPRLTLYLDRYADNAPVTDARIELDAGGRAVAVRRQADGSYAAELPAGARAATLPLTLAVTAGETSDLLAVDLPPQAAPGADRAAGLAAADAAHAADPPPAARDVTAAAVLRGLLAAAVLLGLTALALRALGRRRRASATEPAPALPAQPLSTPPLPAPAKDPA